MTGQNSPALYEDPSRISRLVVISCAVVAGLLTFLIILPPLLSLFGHSSATASHNEINDAASAPRSAATTSFDQLSQTPKPVTPANEAAAADHSGTAAMVDTSRTIASSGVETPQQVPQEPPAPAPATSGASQEQPSAWVAAVQSTPDPAPTAEVDAEPVAQLPLPRVRPHHHVPVAGIAAVPLPTPRPSVPTEAASAEREAAQQRYDPF
jgi:hypothetical protein